MTPEPPIPIKTAPLFAAASEASSTATILPSHKITSSDASKAETPATSTTAQITPYLRKPKSSFASIITGGRSPSHDVPVPELLPPIDTGDSVLEELSAIETELMISKKMLKRKRRIEFDSTVPVAVNRANSSPREGGDSTSPPRAGDGGKEANGGSEDGEEKRTVYANFQKGGAEFSDPAEGAELEADNSKPDDTNAQLKMDISDLKSTLVEKLKFLCQDRPEVSPVQVIQIQMQVGHLFTPYLFLVFLCDILCNV